MPRLGLAQLAYKMRLSDLQLSVHTQERGGQVPFIPRNSDEFRAWQKQHLHDGWVINVGPDGPRLHRANCKIHLMWFNPKTGLERLEKNWVNHQKICSVNREELIALYPRCRPCGHCLRGSNQVA